MIAIAVNLASCPAGASFQPSGQPTPPETAHASRVMGDGKSWTVHNLTIDVSPSYCYGDAEPNCRRYGRLYTWESAQRACRSLGPGWRLPSDEAWRQLARLYGGISADSKDRGKAAYRALMSGGNSGFNALLGGGRSGDAQYARLEAHGFYWTASESDPAHAYFYNFGKGGRALHQQTDGEKERAFSVRCVREGAADPVRRPPPGKKE